jgi:dipeptidyl aminopeptidase/acylaminoacyl peptidase
MMTRQRKRIKIIIAVIVVPILVTILALLLLSIYIYDANFNLRFTTNPESLFAVEEFDGLNRERYTFASNKGQTLVGYRYFKEVDAKGVVVLAHGFGGGGHNVYMDVANYFTSNGYTVFAYDATGNDESEGDGVGGLPQGVIDLDYALRFVKESPAFEGLPILLFGHSWGAYSAGSVLNLHPDISAVVMGAGFNRAIDMFEEEGRRQAGSGIDMVLPFIPLIELTKFGAYQSYTCVDGLASSNAGAMIIHSTDDDIVSFTEQYGMFEKMFRDNPRFAFVRYEDRGHNGLFNNEGSLDTELMGSIVAFYDTYASSTQYTD